MLRMPAGLLAWSTVAVIVVSNASAQYLFQRKDAAFAQVAAGGNIETRIVLTNRGNFIYQGVIYFSTGMQGRAWNVFVNGSPIENGSYSFQLNLDEVLTLRITDPGSDVARGGNAVIVADDLTPDNFLECNLTFYITDHGEITDSVGILPGDEFYLASLPFEDFSQIALALTDTRFPDEAGENTTDNQVILLSLLDDEGNLLDTLEVEGLKPWGHAAMYLPEYFVGDPFSGKEPRRGKVEIASPYPVVATALTQVGPELSSLPLQAAPVGHEVSLVHEDGTQFTGSAALWAEGYFVRGYLTITQVNDSDVAKPLLTLINGQLIDGILDLTFFAPAENFWGPGSEKGEVVVYVLNEAFSFDEMKFSGDYLFTYTNSGTTEAGKYNLTRTTP